MRRFLARIEPCLFIVSYPGWLFLYALASGLSGWEPVDVDLAVHWIWSLLWAVLITWWMMAWARDGPRTASHQATKFAPSKFGVWLKRVREQHLGWSQYELATACGVPIAVVRGWESGRIPEPDPDLRQHIFAAIYGALSDLCSLDCA